MKEKNKILIGDPTSGETNAINPCETIETSDSKLDSEKTHRGVLPMIGTGLGVLLSPFYLLFSAVAFCLKIIIIIVVLLLLFQVITKIPVFTIIGHFIRELLSQFF